MSKGKSGKSNPVLLILIILLSACHKPEKKVTFDLEGECKITFINNTKKPIKLKIENWYVIPLKSQEIDTTILPNSSLQFDLIAQGYNYYKTTINKKKYNIFKQPGAIDSVLIGKTNISFSGNLKAINEFQYRKIEKFHSVDADWLERANATHREKTFDRIIKINDSITQIHQKFLLENSNKLPHWYNTFESNRLQYLNSGFILNSWIYRKAMLDMRDNVSKYFLFDRVSGIEINNKNMQGNIRYLHFLNNYIGHKGHMAYEGKDPIKITSNKFDIIKKELIAPVNDMYTTFSLSMFIDNNKSIFDTALFSQVKNKEMNNFLRKQFSKEPMLPKGVKLPYFYLRDDDEVQHESSEFIGKIVLINFWATWCKPCIKEFPFENSLVKKYKKQPVAIVNICVESRKNDWQSMIEKYNLTTLNLYAEGNWDNLLKSKYNIGALPHSVLIDWNGKVVTNKCARASNNIEKQIDELLKQKKKEALATLKFNE